MALVLQGTLALASGPGHREVVPRATCKGAEGHTPAMHGHPAAVGLPRAGRFQAVRPVQGLVALLEIHEIPWGEQPTTPCNFSDSCCLFMARAV